MHLIDLTVDSDNERSPKKDLLSSDDGLYNDAIDNDNIGNEAPYQPWPRLEAEPNMNGPQIPAPASHPAQPNNPFDAASIFGDYVLDEDFDDERIARQFAKFESDPPIAAAQPTVAEPAVSNSGASTAAIPVTESKDECIMTVLKLFPDVCPEHVSDLYHRVSSSSDRLIAHILDNMEKGSQPPKAKDKQKTLKRKREVTEEEAAALNYDAPDRPSLLTVDNLQFVRRILEREFTRTPIHFIDATLSQTRDRLYQAYRVLDEAQRSFDPKDPPYLKLRRTRKMDPEFQDANVEALIAATTTDISRKEILRELQAARRLKQTLEDKRRLEIEHEREEEANELKAIAEGTMHECGCCFSDFPLNRMVHCNADELHWFCRNCARQNADTEIGNSKYELRCMSMDGCNGGFSTNQRSIFLDNNRIVALERNEQEAVLRMAGIENLESCPFCPYAVEYNIPVEVNKEFRCEAPDCEKVSCRLCRLESHIPLSCEESAKENGLSIRRQIEEAMSAALIRKCNKCGTPFVKLDGCNKMTCTRNGCGNVQCYVCSKSCGYDHFDDRNRGGKKGNCPLFESTAARHDGEVSKAEKEALEKVRAEHPEYTEEDLKIKVSEKVSQDEKQQLARENPHMHIYVPLQLAAARIGHQLPAPVRYVAEPIDADPNVNMQIANVLMEVNNRRPQGHLGGMVINVPQLAAPAQVQVPQLHAILEQLQQVRALGLLPAENIAHRAGEELNHNVPRPHSPGTGSVRDRAEGPQAPAEAQNQGAPQVDNENGLVVIPIQRGENEQEYERRVLRAFNRRWEDRNRIYDREAA